MNARMLMVCLGLALAAASPVGASGAPEARLDPAARLIEAQDYSGALLLLAQLQRQSPELSEDISRLISQVITVRGQEYNKVMTELLHTMFVEQDDQKSVKLIAQLQKIDPVRAGQDVEFGTDFIHLLRLLNDANARIAVGRLVDAVSLYLLPIVDPGKAGFDMQKSRFQSARYGPIIVGSVNDAVAQMQGVAEREVKDAVALAAVPSAVSALLMKPVTAQGPGAFDAAVAPIARGAQSEQSVRELGAFFQRMNKRIGESGGETKVDPYLRSLTWLALGREKKVEGIAFALRRLWEDRANDVENSTTASLVDSFKAARALYDAGKLEAADAAFAEVGYRSVLSVKAAALAGSGEARSRAQGLPLAPDRATALLGHLTRASGAQETAAEAAGFRLLIGYRQDLARMPLASPNAAVDPVRAAEESAQLADARSALESRSREARDSQGAWLGRAAAWVGRESTGIDAAPLAASAREMAGLFGAFAEADLRDRDLAYALRLAKIASASFPGRLNAAVAMRRQGQDLKDGTMNGEVPPGQVGIPEKHPELAIPVFQDASGRFDALTVEISGLEEKLAKEKPYVVASAELNGMLKGTTAARGLDQLLATAREERLTLDKLLADAEKQREDAAVLSREGDNQYDQAVKALKKENAEEASSFADQANDRYVQSQTIAWSKHAVTRTDVDIPDLQREIAKLRNNIAIATAQKAVTAIKARFKAGDYQGSSDALDEAEALWAKAHPDEPYPLFTGLRQDIQNALVINAGRTLYRYDPRADVVNTFIRYAQDNLAHNRLKEAQANVNDALAVAPNLGTARLLDLKIKKQNDPEAFQKEALAQIDSYIKAATDKEHPERYREIYNALIDYGNLDPAFKQKVEKTVQELRYDLGMEQRPATLKQKKQAADKVRQADALQQQGTTEAWNQARALLAEALKIDRDSVEAQRLDAEILKKMANVALAGLSPSDTKKYKQALSLYIANAYQDAYDIVLSLWNDPKSPRNKTYEPLRKLKKRCEGPLGL
jgi:hypothetical protein